MARELLTIPTMHCSTWAWRKLFHEYSKNNSCQHDKNKCRQHQDKCCASELRLIYLTLHLTKQRKKSN